MKSLRLLALAFMLAVGILALSGSAQASKLIKSGKSPVGGACTPGSVVPSPNVPGRSELFGMDALSDSDIWAVGSYFTPTTSSTVSLVQHFDGAVWTQVPSPNAESNYNQLKAVSAVSANDVWAVGNSGSTSGYGLLVIHWNGSTWRIVPTPNPSPGYFTQSINGVVAISANDVWAVGYYSDNTGSHTLTLHWNGTQWALVAIPSGPDYPLFGVTAVSTTDVWAVGGWTGLSSTPLILHWDGSAWADFSGPSTGMLASVDAVSADDIWAVGTTGQAYSDPYQTVTMHWDGSAWSVVPSPNFGTAPASYLYGVSSIASNNVWAVGLAGSIYPYDDYSMFQTLIEHWNGTEWSIVANPAAPTGKLFAVNALAANDVLVAGAQGRPATLVERWDSAQWSVVASPNPGRATNGLAAVDAISPVDVWAVGSYRSYSNIPVADQKTLIQHWDGYNWSIVPSPNGAGPENLLNSVDAISASDVWAVGMSGSGGDYWTLTMHWDGAAWTVVQSPSPGMQPKYLQSVSALAANDVWAVGFLSDGGLTPSQSFIIHWDGSTWSVVSSPNAGLNSNYLYGVTAISANDVWAAGFYRSDSDSILPLTLHWDGTQWTQVSAPSSTNAALFSISAVSANDVWAVGDDQLASVSQTLVMHWDGTVWSVVPSPSFGAANNYLHGVSVVSSNDVWAAGWFEGGTIIEHWDGAAWSITYITTPCMLGNILRGISALSANDVWVAGEHSDGEPSQTLIEHIGRFSDVNPGDYFFTPVSYLIVQGAISGYEDCTFRPGNDTTRGQLSKIVTLAHGWTLLDPTSPTFTDVARGSTFYQYIETMVARGLISGYPCGDPNEPCDSENRPYFRPNAQVTRGQITKIVVLAEGWTLQDPVQATFTDVAPGSTFYTYVETASAHTIINGYGCGGPNEPCDSQNRPYFRPGFSATRGQIAKVVYNAVTNP